LILLPFIKPLTAFTRLLVPDKVEVEQAKVTQFIDDQARGVSSSPFGRPV
jgi:Na+/phosphate symporter